VPFSGFISGSRLQGAFFYKTLAKTLVYAIIPVMLSISLRAEVLFYIGSFPVTNALFLSSIVFLLIIALGLTLRRKLKIVPNMMQNIAEIVVEGALDIMDTIVGDRRQSEKYFPLVFTIFLFVLFSNWLGLLPGVGSFVLHQGAETVPLLRSPGSDLNFTLALALISITFVNFAGAAALGIKGRLSNFFNFKGPVEFFVGILEIVSEFAKVISLSFRLFGNVFAGEVLLAILAYLTPYLIPLPFMFLEIFVGFIQAFIFAMLTTVFVGMALTGHAEEHGGEHQEGHAEKVAH
jgi:F-type H+-transporting ATPase subunit a